MADGLVDCDDTLTAIYYSEFPWALCEHPPDWPTTEGYTIEGPMYPCAYEVDVAPEPESIETAPPCPHPVCAALVVGEAQSGFAITFHWSAQWFLYLDEVQVDSHFCYVDDKGTLIIAACGGMGTVCPTAPVGNVPARGGW